MILDLGEYDLVKAISRNEAKAVHKDLPPGGVWRTVKGHHIYIVGNDVVAGSIPGVTKAKKATKAHIKEHQAHVDKEAKKKGAGTNATTKKAGTKPKATTKGSQPVSNDRPKPIGSTTTKGKPKSTKSTKGQASLVIDPHASVMKMLASNSDDGMDMYGLAGEHTNHMNTLKEAMKTVEGKKTVDKLNALHAKYKGASKTKKASKVDPNKFELGKERHTDSNYQVLNQDGLEATARATGKKIAVNPDAYKVFKEPVLQHMLHHELGHTLTERFPGLEGQVMSNPNGIFGSNNDKEGKFEPSLNLEYGGSKWKGTPEEVWADAYALYQTNPAELMKQSPELHDFVGNVVSKIPGHEESLKEVRDLFESSRPKKPKPNKLEMGSDGLVLYHGTKLRNIESILEHGFDLNGSEDDFGDAVYFKSPAYDHLDHKDFADWRDERIKAGKPVPAKYMDKRGEDTVSIVSSFTGKYDGAVVKAIVPKEHVLDCSSGRPEELQSLIDEYAKDKLPTQRIRLAFKHILGETIEAKDDEAVYDVYDKRRTELSDKWGGANKFMAGKISPYELYAKKHGIGVIVDKLDHYKEEGWQIGVYNPKLINVAEHGKGIEYKDGVSLMKALMKAMKQNNNAHCLVHHEMTDKGLELHIGAYRTKDGVEKSISGFRSLVQGWRGDTL